MKNGRPKSGEGFERCAIPKWIRGTHKDLIPIMMVKGQTYEYFIDTEFHGEGFPHFVRCERRLRTHPKAEFPKRR